MKRVELYQKVRRAVLIDGMSRRAAARYFGINRKTVDKMLCFPEPGAWPEWANLQPQAGGIYRDHRPDPGG
jgi:transposase